MSNMNLCQMNKSCQRQILIPSILRIGEGEIDKIGKYLLRAGFKNIACFFSEGIEEIYGERIVKSLELYGLTLAHKDTISEINIENVIHTAFSISKNVDVLIGIGGGKAIDYCKYCAHVLAMPFISVPTSTSNDGFCSPTASLLVEGRRKTINARIPFGIIADLTAIKNSPESCIYSGIGDLISKVTSGWDWKEAVRRGNDVFHDFAYILSQNQVMDILDCEQEDRRSISFLYKLINALLMSGIAMEIAGSSRPASGSEHLISHALDKISDKPQMHGIQVGIGTYICSYVQDNSHENVKNFLLNTGFFDFITKYPIEKSKLIEAIELAPSIKEDFYTILSEPEMRLKAVEFVNTDETLKKVLV